MKLLMFVFVLSVAVCDIELELKATDGENCNIPLEGVELERANRVRITLKRKNEEKHVVVQFCDHGENCSVVETPGVLLFINNRTLILQHVSSNTSGLYEAKVFFGNKITTIKATLVNIPAVSSTKVPPHTSTPKPPNSSEYQWLYALLILPVIFGVVVFVFCWKKCRKEHNRAVEDGRETPDVSRTSIFKKKYWKRNCTDCAAVSFKTCRGDIEDQLMDI